ncbi:MAG TPA: DUF2127 domain-containing protein [Candidatus Paceibacterota bacterium]|jgi:uncharacterized membrane protein|nr:DUF2127 domain-containing protein [Candidatus Paceibacterota bacterium]
MAIVSEKTYHRVFWGGIIIKGLISVGELLLGVLFLFFSYATLFSVAVALTGDELTESPRDPLWNLAVHSFNGFTATPQAIWAFIFLSHGIVKTFMIVGLIKDWLWIYPVSAIVFAAFAAYQIYQYTYAPSFFLIAITVFDVILIGLILHEYRYERRNRRPRSAIPSA